MARVLILSTNSKVDDLNDKICYAIDSYTPDTEDIDSILSRAFCTKCPKCIKRFMEDIKRLGFFKCYWEPRVFYRNKAKFIHETNRYYLELNILIDDKELRLANRQFSTHFSGEVVLRITDKQGCNISPKIVKLFDLHCDSFSKSAKEEYVKSMHDYIEETFGIDFNKWNENSREIRGSLYNARGK